MTATTDPNKETGMSDHQMLIAPNDLQEILDDPDVAVIDVRWSLDDNSGGRRSYEREHIPGAVYLDWLKDWSDPQDPTEGQLARPEQFEQAMRSAGVKNDSLVVAYDDNDIFMAPRLLWALHHYGHDRVQVLDGGWAAWVARQYPTEAVAPIVDPGNFEVNAERDLRLTLDEVRAIVDAEATSAVLLDCRMDRTWEESGAHIPGARRLPSPTLVRPEDGRAISTADITARADQLGIEPDTQVVLYCGGGVSASAGYLALRRAGFRNLKVYDGSWSEWSEADGVPIEQH